MGDCQNYGPFLGPYYNTGPNTGPNLGDPKRDHSFDNHPYDFTYASRGSNFFELLLGVWETLIRELGDAFVVQGLGFRVLGV